MLIVITFERDFPNEKQIIKTILESPYVTLHVRKPNFSVEQLRHWLDDFSKEQTCKMMLHQHHNLAQEYSVKGLHFSEKEKQKYMLTTQQKYASNLMLSAAFHNVADATQQELFSYALLSPVFDSISKEGYSGKHFSIQKARKSVIALGGITPQRVKQTFDLGFNGIAVLGYIWKNPSPINAWKSILHEYLNTFSKL